MRILIAAPLILIVPAAAALNDSQHGNPWDSGASASGVSLYLVFLVFVLLQASWLGGAYARTHGHDPAHAVDWSEPQWQPVTKALTTAGYDLTAIQAVST
jgi:hypothetical protein